MRVKGKRTRSTCFTCHKVDSVLFAQYRIGRFTDFASNVLGYLVSFLSMISPGAGKGLLTDVFPQNVLNLFLSETTLHQQSLISI